MFDHWFAFRAFCFCFVVTLGLRLGMMYEALGLYFMLLLFISFYLLATLQPSQKSDEYFPSIP